MFIKFYHNLIRLWFHYRSITSYLHILCPRQFMYPLQSMPNALIPIAQSIDVMIANSVFVSLLYTSLNSFMISWSIRSISTKMLRKFTKCGCKLDNVAISVTIFYLSSSLMVGLVKKLRTFSSVKNFSNFFDVCGSLVKVVIGFGDGNEHIVIVSGCGVGHSAGAGCSASAMAIEGLAGEFGGAWSGLRRGRVWLLDWFGFEPIVASETEK